MRTFFAVILSCFLLFSAVSAQPDTTVNASVKYIGEKVDKAFSAIATKIGVTVDYVYPLIVRQKVIEGTVSLAFGVVGFLCGIIGIPFSYRSRNKKRNGADYDDGFAFFDGGQVVGESVLIIFGIAGLLAGFILCPNGILMLSNPEYYAIQEILRAIQ